VWTHGYPCLSASAYASLHTIRCRGKYIFPNKVKTQTCYDIYFNASSGFIIPKHTYKDRLAECLVLPLRSSR
jgi:hypothetical protein